MNITRTVIAAAVVLVGFTSPPAEAQPPTGHGIVVADDPDPNIPPPPPPPTPFCTPRGGLFIVGPICDEIGVGPPQKHG